MKNLPLVVDIETIPDPAIPFAFKERRESTHENVVDLCDSPVSRTFRRTIDRWVINPDEFPPNACWQVAVIGVFSFAHGFRCAPGETERERLSNFVELLEKTEPLLVSYNGRGFDMPVVSARAFRYGLSMGWWFGSRNTRYRYSSDGHLDVMDYLADYGTRLGKLDQVARLVGFPGKLSSEGEDQPMDGSRVASELATPGGRARVEAYCLSDVAQTTAIYLRLQLLRGLVTVDEYREDASSLLRHIDATPGLEALASQIERESFLEAT